MSACGGDSDCDAAEACSDGSCVETCTADADCTRAGASCKDSRCTARPCEGVDCPGSQQCARGECVATDCGGATCSDGQVCDTDGQTCVDPACHGVTCGTYEACVEGACEPVCPLPPCDEMRHRGQVIGGAGRGTSARFELSIEQSAGGDTVRLRRASSCGSYRSGRWHLSEPSPEATPPCHGGRS